MELQAIIFASGKYFLRKNCYFKTTIVWIFVEKHVNFALFKIMHEQHELKWA